MPKSSLTKDEVKAMLILACDRVIAAEPQLSEADRNLGDGDHGLGMQRGMTAAKEGLEAGEIESIEKAFVIVGTKMMSSMGGASGAIFGTFFRNGGKALAGKESFDAAGLAAFLQAGVDGVKQRGGAAVGDKTVVDAMQPAALDGLEASKAMVAKFGRAKTLGDAAIGFPDAGAMSVTVIIGAFADYIAA
jgi:dihydroxyacetone kinase-like protein